MMATLETCLLAAIVGVFFMLLTGAFSGSIIKHSQGPPEVTATIPYFGHAIGLFWHRSAYYTRLCQKWKAPIISISMLGSKLHIVSSADIVQSLERQGKLVSFWTMEARFIAGLGNLSKAGAEKLAANMEPTSEKPSLLLNGMKATNVAMSTQGGLDDMIRVAADIIKVRLDDLFNEVGGGKSPNKLVNFWDWVQHEITMVTTDTFYGPANPYQDPKVEAGFWNFAENNIILLLTQSLPDFTAYKAKKSRATVVSAFRRYFANNSHEEGSALVKARHSTLSPEISLDDVAKFECVNGIGIMANTVPTTFWTFFHIFSDPSLLEEIRKQVRAITTISQSFETGILEYKISVRSLKDAPLLFSVQQEALRFRATGTQPRTVMQDILIGKDQYLLEKDSVVIISNRTVGFDEATWGADADSFRADRFDNSKVPGCAFRGFGGGLNLCPGKNFALAEVAALMAMLVMRFDVVPEGGSWGVPGQDLSNMSLQIAPPGRKVLVTIVPRKGASQEKWGFE